MNWYVLYVLNYKSNKILANLNRRKELEAFIPESEVFHRESKDITTKPMFNNYILVKTMLNQEDFNDLLLTMRNDNDGLIRQLKNQETSALSSDEITFFNTILDKQHIVRISHGYKENGRTVITDGPLLNYQDHIVKVDTHNHTAYLDLTFFDRRIVVGIEITSKN